MSENNVMNVISLGAGVQSSTMAIMAARGEIEPMPDCAIFADTQAEPKKVYEWLDWLEKQLPFPVYRATKGDLGEAALRVHVSRNGIAYTKSSPPAYIVDPAGKRGILMRQCTEDYKLVPLFRKMRELRHGIPVVQWIGISWDEADRMKPARQKWLTSWWPLVEMRITREDCLRWMADRGYPKPPRSACYFCPYHNDSEWMSMDPDEFQRAVEWEKKFQETYSQVPSFRGVPYLHASRKPLDQVQFDSKKQLNLFRNECVGMCGV